MLEFKTKAGQKSRFSKRRLVMACSSKRIQELSCPKCGEVFYLHFGRQLSKDEYIKLMEKQERESEELKRRQEEEEVLFQKMIREFKDFKRSQGFWKKVAGSVLAKLVLVGVFFSFTVLDIGNFMPPPYYLISGLIRFASVILTICATFFIAMTANGIKKKLKKKFLKKHPQYEHKGLYLYHY